MEDWLELQDPEMQKQIAEGYEEYRQGRTRPLDDFLNEEKVLKSDFFECPEQVQQTQWLRLTI